MTIKRDVHDGCNQFNLLGFLRGRMHTFAATTFPVIIRKQRASLVQREAIQ